MVGMRKAEIQSRQLPRNAAISSPSGSAGFSAALHIITVTRGLAVLERAFGDEAQLRKIAAHTIGLVLGKPGG